MRRCWMMLVPITLVVPVLWSQTWAEDTKSVPGPSVATDPKALEFFESKIRPVLVEHCYRCHSDEAVQNKKLKAGLLLDSKEGLLKGGDSGPALVPGKAAESLLFKTLKYDGDVQMPPKGKLPDNVIADVEKWINMGAPDPRTATGTRKAIGMSIEEGRKFWSYRPIQDPVLPALKTTTTFSNPIDPFIQAGLEAKGLTLSTSAEKSQLIRRLYYDLTGLPPSPEAVAAFVKEASSAAYEKIVDQLLASPEFGERWGRHWLDVARYAESLTLRGFIFKEAWRYRDYVIDSFNKDVPFDQFIREQIAGDLLPHSTIEDKRRHLVATTFLVLGNTNLEEQDKKMLRMDVVDEQLDAITKGFLGQTVTCARCHDHKFDPIPTKDYYALAGILRNAKAMEHANVSKWIDVPLPVDPSEEKKLKQHEAQIAALQSKIQLAKGKSKVTTAEKGILAIADINGIVVDDTKAKKVGVWQESQHSGTFIGTGYSHDQDMDKGNKTLTFQPDLPATGKYEVRLAYSPGSNRCDAVPVTVFSADGEKTLSINMKQTPPLQGRFVSLGEYRFEKTGQSFVIISNEGTKGHVIADAVVFLPVDEAEANGGSKNLPKNKTNTIVAELEAELKKLTDRGPKRPMVMSVLEESTIEDAKVHIRGSVHNLGEVAPRGFLQVATWGTVPSIPAKQSGRKELAEWIASKQNPLTARVIANRTWHWLFGSGLVRTTDNFGTTGEKPSHPELLDYLASRFLEDGWSMKKLIRRIVLSQTYQQTAVASKEALALDPENRLFGRANRRRLEAECIRDTMLVVSGQLKQERGGPKFPQSLAADYGFQSSDLLCRSVYLPVFRNAMPEMLEVFDFADSSMVMGRRNVSTVAPQALFLMNHPFSLEQSKQAAKRLLAEEHASNEQRIQRAYRLTLGRDCTPGEQTVALKFLDNQPDDAQRAWTALFHALFSSADFRYVN